MKDDFALPLIQNCWVVPDIDAAIKPWVALGVGPFFTFDVDMPDAFYRGKPVPLAFSVALAQAGPMQIELIRQRSDGPSAYRDEVPEGASGFHHVCRGFGEYDETLTKLLAQGGEVATEFVLGGARACYVDVRSTHGCMIELADDSPIGQKLIAAVRDAAIGWDGRDPVRPLTLM